MRSAAPACCSTARPGHAAARNSLVLGSAVGGPVLLSARTCSAPARSSSAGYLRIARLDRAGALPAAWSAPAPATTRRASRWPPSCHVHPPHRVHAGRRAAAQVEATQGYVGARFPDGRPDVDDALAAAQEYAATSGAVFVHPFDHPDASPVRGSRRAGDPGAAPAGTDRGRGVAAAGLEDPGWPAAIKGAKPDARWSAARRRRRASYRPRLAAGRLVTLDSIGHDGRRIAVRRGGELTFGTSPSW